MEEWNMIARYVRDIFITPQRVGWRLISGLWVPSEETSTPMENKKEKREEEKKKPRMRMRYFFWRIENFPSGQMCVRKNKFIVILWKHYSSNIFVVRWFSLWHCYRFLSCLGFQVLIRCNYWRVVLPLEN